MIYARTNNNYEPVVMFFPDGHTATSEAMIGRAFTAEQAVASIQRGLWCFVLPKDEQKTQELLTHARNTPEQE